MWKRVLLVVATLSVAAVARAEEEDDFDGSANFETFQEPLAVHGSWAEAGEWGWVWRPAGVVSTWRPYFEGRWVWTDGGWLWDSEEPWGWATYHYGRWAWDSAWGWFWVPGYRWAPSWVDWRYGDSCVGWAPRAPYRWVSRHRYHHEHWTFVGSRSFHSVQVRHAAYSPGQIEASWTGSVEANAGMPVRATVGYSGPVHEAAPAGGGPPRQFIERHLARPILPVRPVVVERASDFGRHRGSPAIFRPSVRVVPRTVPAPRVEVRTGTHLVVPVPGHVDRRDDHFVAPPAVHVDRRETFVAPPAVHVDRRETHVVAPPVRVERRDTRVVVPAPVVRESRPAAPERPRYNEPAPEHRSAPAVVVPAPVHRPPPSTPAPVPAPVRRKNQEEGRRDRR